MAVIKEKLGDETTHIRFPPELKRKIGFLAEYHRRTFNAQVLHLLDERVNGPLELRLLADSEEKK